MRQKIEDIIWELVVNKGHTVDSATDAIMSIIEEEKKAATLKPIDTIANGLANARVRQ